MRFIVTKGVNKRMRSFVLSKTIRKVLNIVRPLFREDQILYRHFC